MIKFSPPDSYRGGVWVSLEGPVPLLLPQERDQIVDALLVRGLGVDVASLDVLFQVRPI